jgi:hypothetical protein
MVTGPIQRNLKITRIVVFRVQEILVTSRLMTTVNNAGGEGQVILLHLAEVYQLLKYARPISQRETIPAGNTDNSHGGPCTNSCARNCVRYYSPRTATPPGCTTYDGIRNWSLGFLSVVFWKGTPNWQAF